MKPLDELFRNESKDVFGFPCKKIITDVETEEFDYVFYNPVPKKAIVDVLSAEKVSWKFLGKKVNGAISLIIEADDLPDFKKFGKVEYNDNAYYGYTDDTNKFEILELPDENYVKITLWRQ